MSEGVTRWRCCVKDGRRIPRDPFTVLQCPPTHGVILRCAALQRAVEDSARLSTPVSRIFLAEPMNFGRTHVMSQAAVKVRLHMRTNEPLVAVFSRRDLNGAGHVRVAVRRIGGGGLLLEKRGTYSIPISLLIGTFTGARAEHGR